MVGHPAMLRENQPDCCLPCPNVPALNSQTCWRCKDTGASWPNHLRLPSPGLSPRLHGTPYLPPTNHDRAYDSEIEGVPPHFWYLYTALWWVKCLKPTEFTKDLKCKNESKSALLTVECPSTGQYTVYCVVMQLTSRLQMTAVCWVNLTVKTSNEGMEWNFCAY